MPQKPRGTHQRSAQVIELRRQTRPPAGDAPGRYYFSPPPPGYPSHGAGRPMSYQERWRLERSGPKGALGQLRGFAQTPGMVTGGGVTISPELVVAEVQRLATLYDTARPLVSFSQWVASQGAGAVLEQYRGILSQAAAAGDGTAAARLSALDELPPWYSAPPASSGEVSPAPAAAPAAPALSAEHQRILSDPAFFEAELTRLANAYDAAKPQQSFSAWAASQGAGPIVDEYKKLLASTGDAAAIAELDKAPPPPPPPESKRKKRRKKLKKLAAVAAIAVGAVFLGPMVAGAFKAVMAKGAIAGKLAAAGKAAKLAKVVKVAATAAKVIPKVIQGVNAVNTVRAIRDGEVPPPPIELNGTRFVDYASAIGTNLAERELQQQGQQVDAARRALLEQDMAAEIRELQTRANYELPVPAGRLPMYTLPNVSPDVRNAMAASSSGDVLKFAAIGGAVLVVGLMLARSR